MSRIQIPVIFNIGIREIISFSNFYLTLKRQQNWLVTSKVQVHDNLSCKL